MTRLGRLSRRAVAALPTPISEAQFMTQVTQLAEMRGWEWAHFRPAMRADGRWYTAVSGPLGKGWPDLVLVRERDRRLIFAELKRDGAKTAPEQERVLNAFVTVAEVYVWHPAEWATVESVLR